MWILWLLSANAAIFLLEYLYRSAKFTSFITALPWVIIPILIGQVGLFYGFRGGGASTLIYAGIIFTLINLILRILNSLILSEPISTGTWIAVVLMALAVVVQKVL